MKICLIVGTRPEIIKMAPVIHECIRRKLDFFILHTGQHYSYEMDQLFFKELELPPPRYNINAGLKSFRLQIGMMLRKIKEILVKERPGIVLVLGDTNSVLSGALALALMYGFVRLLALIVPNFIRANMRMIAFTLGLTYVILNFLYFTNIIPPIPLSLKELGVYHNVEKLENGSYALTYEQGKWYEFFKDSDTAFHYQTGDTVYCFASVFAPTRLSTEIFHRWEYYVPEDHEWRTHSRLSYGIDGGRDGGFRGYSWVRHPTEGKWRCTVETARKQVLGSETFEVVGGRVPSGLVTELR